MLMAWLACHCVTREGHMCLETFSVAERMAGRQQLAALGVPGQRLLAHERPLREGEEPEA